MTGTDLTIGVGSGSTITAAVDDWQSTANGTAADIATGATSAAADAAAGEAFNFTAAFEDLGDAAEALLAMDKVTAALEGIGKSRAELGANINALKASADSLVDLADRYESNASAIGDADYAAESASLATAQIVSQAATAMLAQANAQKNTVLALLK